MEAWAAAVLSPNLLVANGAYGFSVHARSAIEKGDLLVRVPAELAVTAESALRGPTVQALVSRETEAHVTIAVWLLHAATLQHAHGDYSRALSEADIDCTLSWSEAELSLLQQSRAAGKAHHMQAWAQDEWLKITKRPAFAASPMGNSSSLPDFRWALCAVWSRSFQMRCASADCDGAAGTSGGVWRVLAPGADLLNHAGDGASAVLEVRADGAQPEKWGAVNSTTVAIDTGGATGGAPAAEASAGADASDAARATAAASWSRGNLAALADASAALMLRAARRIEAGEEVTLDYGARSNSELLTTHGFALPNNPNEATPLSLEPASADPLGEIKRKLLTLGNLSPPYALSAKALSSDSDIVVALRIGSANAAELQGQDYQNAFKGLPLSARNERRWRSMLRERVTALLGHVEAETTASVDEAILIQMGPPSRERSSMRKRGALLTRLGEKQSLHDVLAALDRMRADAEAADEPEPSAASPSRGVES